MKIFYNRLQGKLIYFICFCLAAFASCGNSEKMAQIERLKQQMAEFTYQVQQLQSENAYKNTALDSLETLKNNLFAHSRSLLDSVGYYKKESPMACAYIEEFDKEPVDILIEYVKTNEDERGDLLFAHAILVAYSLWGDNQSVIDALRNDLKRLDDSRKSDQAKIVDIDIEVKNTRSQIDANLERISATNMQKDQVSAELNHLQN